jgi:hypothetical protein
MGHPLFGLEQYIEQENRWTVIFGNEPYTFPLSQEDVDSIAGRIDSQLSPENLHMDGEASAQHVRVTYKRLTTAAKELFEYCERNGLKTPMLYEI